MQNHFQDDLCLPSRQWAPKESLTTTEVMNASGYFLGFELRKRDNKNINTVL
jgi:hypothetical protein